MKNKNRVLKYGVVLAFCGMLGGVGLAVYLYNMPKRNIERAKADYVLTAAELHREFQTNEQLANKKYLSAAYGKVIRVSGTIAEIELRGDSALNILLREPSMKDGSVNCSMDNSQIGQAKDLKPGDIIELKGECAGFLDLTNEVALIKCVLEKK